MALETIQKVNVNSYTKVGELSRAIETWEKVGKATSDPEQKRIAKEQMDKNIQAKSHLVNIITSKFGFLCEESKYKVAQLFKEDGKHKYDNLSIEIMNKYLDQENQIYADEQTLNPEDSLGMKILEGKTGVDYMTVVKSTMAISAVSLLAQGGVFGGVAAAISSIMAFNPVVGVCVIALGTASLIKMARKIFAPEIKKLCAQERVRQKFNQIESSSDLQVDMDAYKSEDWAQEAKPSETGKPAPKPKTLEEFNAYKQHIYDMALEAFQKGENFMPPYGDKVIKKETMDEVIERAKMAAKGKGDPQDQSQDQTKQTPSRTTGDIGKALAETTKAVNEQEKKVNKLQNEVNEAFKNLSAAKSDPSKIDPVKVAELQEKVNEAQTSLDDAKKTLDELKTAQQDAQLDFDIILGGKKGNLAEEYRRLGRKNDTEFIDFYKGMVQSLAKGTLSTKDKDGKRIAYDKVIEEARTQATSDPNNPENAFYDDLFNNLKNVYDLTKAEFDNIKATKKTSGGKGTVTKADAKGALETQLKAAGFDDKEIEEMLKSPEKQ